MDYQGASITSSEYSSSCSSTSSIHDNIDGNSYIPDWDAYVNDDGSLFYIEYNYTQAVPLQRNNSLSFKDSLLAARNEFKRGSARRNKSANRKMSLLMSKQSFQSSFTKPTDRAASMNANNSKKTPKVKFNETTDGEMKIVHIFIDPSARFKYGRQMSVCEALCGFSISEFPSSQRVMIAGFMPNSSFNHDKSIKVGDCLKLIDNHEVTMDNIETILLRHNVPAKLKFTLQRLAVKDQFSEQSSYGKVTSMKQFSDIYSELLNIRDGYAGDESMCVVNLIYLMMASNSRHDSDRDDVLFSFPTKLDSDLYGIRGTFITLNLLFRESTFKSSLASSTIYINGSQHHVASSVFNDEMLVIGIPAKYATLEETKLKLAEIIRYIEFIQKSVPDFFTHLYMHKQDSHLNNICTILSNLRYLKHVKKQILFEESLLEVHSITLPKEAQLQIEDALGEMEAMDYREWNDDPLNSHREFFILGSALYFRKYLVVSHLSASQLQDVETYLQVTGISHIFDNHLVRNLVIWQEIHLKNADSGSFSANGYPKRRWQLAVVAQNQTMIVALLESRNFNVAPNAQQAAQSPVYPSPFYIEEMQDTLNHLLESGLENLISTWLYSNKRPQISEESAMQSNSPSGANGHFLNNLGTKKMEIISILKRRNNSPDNSTDNKHFPSNALMPSLTSTIADDLNQADNNDSDSDWDGFADSQHSSTGFEMSDVTESLLKELSDVVPTKITSGKENVLLHFVQVDVGDGVLIASPVKTSDSVMHAFRNAGLLIHNVLQNTTRFRQLLANESNIRKHNSHRALVAIKEYGILISPYKGMPEPYDFWVTGRLFSTPVKVLYICHRSNIPQNLVELAFRLMLNSTG